MTSTDNPVLENEQRYRASAYALLAALLRAAPDQALLDHVGGLARRVDGVDGRATHPEPGRELRGSDDAQASDGLGHAATTTLLSTSGRPSPWAMPRLIHRRLRASCSCARTNATGTSYPSGSPRANRPTAK